MNTFVTRCDSIRTSEGKPAVVVIHHFGKDETKGMRGSIALKAAADTVLEVTGMANPRIAKIEKQKDEASGGTFAFNLRPVDVLADGLEPATSCIVEPADMPVSEGKTQRRSATDADLRAKSYLADTILANPMTVYEQGIPTSQKVTTLDSWKASLADHGMIDPLSGRQSAKARNWLSDMKKRLIGANLITVKGSYVWIVGSVV
jgi:hypothetical protein